MAGVERSLTIRCKGKLGLGCGRPRGGGVRCGKMRCGSVECGGVGRGWVGLGVERGGGGAWRVEIEWQGEVTLSDARSGGIGWAWTGLVAVSGIGLERGKAYRVAGCSCRLAVWLSHHLPFGQPSVTRPAVKWRACMTDPRT